LPWLRTFAETLSWTNERVALALFAYRPAPQVRLTRDPNAFFFFLDRLREQPPFGLGLGVSTGLVAAALLGSEERLEYTLVGDTVNLTQRLQQWAEPGETVLSKPTWDALTDHPDADELSPAMVKGRETPVSAHRFPRRAM
jgi:class 3 adenylate cyclase